MVHIAGISVVLRSVPNSWMSESKEVLRTVMIIIEHSLCYYNVCFPVYFLGSVFSSNSNNSLAEAELNGIVFTFHYRLLHRIQVVTATHWKNWAYLTYFDGTLLAACGFHATVQKPLTFWKTWKCGRIRFFNRKCFCSFIKFHESNGKCCKMM